MINKPQIPEYFNSSERISIYHGDCMDYFTQIPSESIQLVVTSPPYNLGKEYESRTALSRYLDFQKAVIKECHRVMRTNGSICWQVGNYVENGTIVPLDTVLYPIFSSLGFKMRNRIIWHFGHGLHCSKRFSGRYETIIWFTKTDEYVFNLDPVRVPQKYPGKKHYKGIKAGEYSSNPKGKNPSDVWEIPNVKSNHIEKTEHPCQYPVELIERLILSMTNPDDWVMDPFLGTGTSIVAALRHGRKGAGSEMVERYYNLAKERIQMELAGTLRTRPMDRPIYDPKEAGNKLTVSPWDRSQLSLKEF